MNGHRLLLYSITILIVTGLSTPLAAQSASAPQSRTVCDAFLLGFSYGNGHNLYSRNTSFTGEVRSQYNSWMHDASEYGKRIGVAVDISPPPADTSSPSRQAGIFKAGQHQAQLIVIALRAKQGDAPAAGLELGYKVALGVEYVPLLTPALQQEVIAEYRTLASKMGLPDAVLGKFTSVLTSTSDRTAVIKALFALKDATADYFEGLELRTATGASRQLEVWSMSWTLGLAALGQAKGADPALIERMFSECRTRAGVLGVQLPMLPEAGQDSARDTATALHYLLNDVGETLSDQLKDRYGPRASALTELAIKSTIALILYGPEDELGQTLAKAIENAGRRAALPSEIYEPLVRKMTARRPQAEVKQEIKALDERVQQYFSPAGNQ